jgi:hypothetical protein
MPGGYADTPGNGPTQSRLTLFARSLEDFIIPGTRTAFRQVRSVSGAAARFFLCAMRDARAAARPAARRAGTLGCRSTLWLGWWLGFKVFPAAQRRDDSAARRYTKPCT